MSASPWDPSSWGGGRNHWKRTMLLFKTQSMWRPCATPLVAPLPPAPGRPATVLTPIPTQSSQGNLGVQRIPETPVPFGPGVKSPGQKQAAAA